MRHARKDYNRIQDPAGLIGEDEPVFLLRAQDELAPNVVRRWAQSLERAGGDPRTVARAMRWALEMEEWQDRNRSKIPDVPEGGSTDSGASAPKYCPNCRGDRWVCENHRSEAQGHDDACSGAGEPCPACNPMATEFSRVLHERDMLRAVVMSIARARVERSPATITTAGASAPEPAERGIGRFEDNPGTLCLAKYPGAEGVTNTCYHTRPCVIHDPEPAREVEGDEG